MPLNMLTPHVHWDSLTLELLHANDADVLPWGRRVKDIPKADYYRVWLLRSGQGRMHIKGRWHDLKIGEWCLPATELDAQEFSDDAKLLSLHLRANWPDGTGLFTIPTKVAWSSQGCARLESAARELVRLARPKGKRVYGEPVLMTNPSLGEHLRMAELFHRWLRLLCEIMTEAGAPPTTHRIMDERVQRGLAWLNQVPLDTKFREPLLAERIGLSVIHMNRLFMRELQLTPASYLERRRWERAAYLLLNTSHSTKEIAYDLGFCAPSYFATWVKNRSGKSPLQFRRKS